MFATSPSRRSRRGASRPLVHVLGLALVLVACGDDGDGAAPPPSTLPPSIAACADAAVGEPAERCLDAIQSALEADTTAWADGGPVTHTAFLWAVNPLVESLGLLPTTTSFSLDSPLRDADDADVEDVRTEPISTTWRIAGSTRTLWTCFDGLSATVSTHECG